jgi:putative pyoverdin transport system ATP-binding/permease protein
MNLLKFLLRHSRHIRFSRLTMFLVLMTSIISGITTIAVIGVANFSLSGAHNTSFRVVGVFGFVFIASAVTRFISEALLIRLVQRSTLEIRLRLGKSILSTSLKQLEEIGTSRLLVLITEDIQAITGLISALPNLCISIVTVIGSLVYLGMLSVKGVAVVLAFIFIGSAMYRWLSNAAMRQMKKARKHQDILFGLCRGLMEGVKELKLHARRCDAFVNGMLRDAATDFSNDTTAALTRYRIAGAFSQLLLFAVIGILLFPGSELINRSNLTAFTLTMMYIMGPLGVILSTVPSLGRASIGVQELEQIRDSLHHETASSMPPARKDPGALPGTLELKDVTHRYTCETDDSFMLGPLNLSFDPGEMVFLIGGNGSGKTTLAKLLVGLYTPETGEIRLGGARLTEDGLPAYQSHFSVVFSDFYLFGGLLGVEEPDLYHRATEYLASLHLSGQVYIQDGKFSTTKLSQGQRKRLALLIAYLEDRAFYVFDEWAADQDPYFKEIFYSQLLPELKRRGKTLLVISHDDKYYSHADRLIKLDRGQVILDSRESIETLSARAS